MKQTIGNVGVLNLMNASETSIEKIERIENVGLAIYRKGNAHLVTSLNIGNIGKSIELLDGYQLYNGILKVDEAYLHSIDEPTQLLVNGMVMFDKDVQGQDIKGELLQLVVNGKIFCPAHLSGVVSKLFSNGSMMMETYEGELPRIENGNFTLNNSFLSSIEQSSHLIVNGRLQFTHDLNMELFSEKIKKLEINGLISIYEDQEAYLYKKAASLSSCVVQVIPSGYKIIKQLRLNGKSIKRFKHEKLYTKKPILIEADVLRDGFSHSIDSIHSTSIIICPEEIEDLVYERCVEMETEVLTYENTFVFIEGEEEWTNDQFLALEKPANFIVNGQLVLNSDVTEETLSNKILTLDVLGEVIVPEKKYIATLQNLIRLKTGIVREEKTSEKGSFIQNLGELSL